MVFLWTAGLRQTEPQLNLDREVTLGRGDVPEGQHTHTHTHTGTINGSQRSIGLSQTQLVFMLCVCVRMLCACVRACACVCACVRACVCARVRVCMREYCVVFYDCRLLGCTAVWSCGQMFGLMLFIHSALHCVFFVL